jgi:hypothetical protein
MENTLSKDTLFLIALELDMPSLFSLCNSNKKLNLKLCENEEFWKIKLRKEFGSYYEKNRRFLKYKDQYLYLKRVLSINNLNNLLERYKILTDYDHDIFMKPLDIYDLIYDTDNSDRSVGFVNTGSHEEEHEFLFFYVLYHLEYLYDNKPGRSKQILQDIRDENINKRILSVIHEEDIEPRIQALGYKDLKDYLVDIPNIVARLQKIIIQRTPKDIRKILKDNMKDLREISYENGTAYNDLKKFNYEKFERTFLSQDEIELIQLLHEAVRENRISIFDPLDETILEKLKR